MNHLVKLIASGPTRHERSIVSVVESIKNPEEFQVSGERVSSVVVIFQACVPQGRADAGLVALMQVLNGHKFLVDTLVDLVDCVRVPGFSGEIMMMMEFIRGMDNVMMVRHPEEGWRRIMNPQEGINLTLIHVFPYQILSTPTPG